MIFARRLAALCVAVLAASGLAAATAPPAAALGSAAGSYVATGPTRVLDTRTGAYGNRLGAVGAHGKVAIKVTGASGVPADAAAVAVTVSVVSATRTGSITASTDGLGSPPAVTTVQFRPDRTATDLALVRPTNGKIDLWNVSAGRVQLVADVLGYYVGGGAPTLDGALHLLPPKRVVHFAGGRIAAHTALTVSLHAAAGLPRTAGAVAATVTVVGPAKAGSLVAYATRTTRPQAPLVDFPAARPRFTTPDSVSQFGVLPISDIQQLSLYNRSNGSLHVLVDVVGWFSDGPAAQPRTQQVVAANRIFADGVVPAHATDTVGVLGRGGVPKTGVTAVLVSARVAGATRAGALVGGSGAGPIVASFHPGQPVTGQAILAVKNGSIRLRNASNGRLALEVDVVGYVVSTAVTAPAAPSVARYVNDLVTVHTAQDLSHDKDLMLGHGKEDAGATFVLLDLGAQTVTAPLSAQNPGIALAKTGEGPSAVRLSYPQLVGVIKAYIDGLLDAGLHVTLAVGTNNEGDWRVYPAALRGTHFANRLISPLQVYGAPRNVVVVGANDIEANFSGTEAQAETWETAYFANTTADLVFNGALNDCPTVFGDRSGCAFGWSQAEYGRLTRHIQAGRNRTLVLPQIYFPIQAVQWANVYAHAGPLRFVGSLTQFASDPTTYEPAQGWAALKRALQWQVANPVLPRAVDIRTP